MIKYSQEGLDSMSKFDRPVIKELRHYIEHHIANLPNPRAIGHALSGNLSHSWTYRWRKNYRIICNIRDKDITIVVVKVAHRKDIYD